MMSPRITARNSMTIRNMELSFALMVKLITMLQISISGARTAMRRIIW